MVFDAALGSQIRPYKRQILLQNFLLIITRTELEEFRCSVDIDFDESLEPRVFASIVLVAGIAGHIVDIATHDMGQANLVSIVYFLIAIGLNEATEEGILCSARRRKIEFRGDEASDTSASTEVQEGINDFREDDVGEEDGDECGQEDLIEENLVP